MRLASSLVGGRLGGGREREPPQVGGVVLLHAHGALAARAVLFVGGGAAEGALALHAAQGQRRQHSQALAEQLQRLRELLRLCGREAGQKSLALLMLIRKARDSTVLTQWQKEYFIVYNVSFYLAMLLVFHSYNTRLRGYLNATLQ